MDSIHWLQFKRKVRFGDCDSAGVLHFHNLFRWSHEFWEESLEIYGLHLNEIFPHSFNQLHIIFPIINCEANFTLPIKLSDSLNINIIPKKINHHLFQVETVFEKNEKRFAQSKLIHCSIDSYSRKKVQLPDNIQRWIEASNIDTKVQEC